MSIDGDSTREVFISYSSHDKQWADATCSVLESHHIRCWIAPRDIIAGTEWGAAIIEGIDASRIMVLIFSKQANDSPQVRREVERALGKGLTIIPFRVEDVRPIGAMEYALSNTHWLDAFTPPVQQKLDELTKSVLSLLKRPSSAKPTKSELLLRVKHRRFSGWKLFAGVAVLGLLLVTTIVSSIIFLQETPKSNQQSETTEKLSDKVIPAVPSQNETIMPTLIDDGITVGSVWEAISPRLTLTVEERTGERFRAILWQNKEYVWLVTGTIKDRQITWLAKDSRAMTPKTMVGKNDFYGMIYKEGSTFRIDVETKPVRGDSTKFTLRLTN